MLRRLVQQRKTVRVYDFRRPDKFSKEQMRALHMIFDSFTRSLTTALSAQLRIGVEVSVRDVGQLTFAEFLDRLEEPTVLALVSLSPLEGSAVLEIDNNLAFLMIDRLFGGGGHAPGSPRALTDIEETIIQRVIRSILDAFAEAWADIIELDPSLRSIESNPMFAQVVSPGEMCANTVFELKLGDQSGRLQFCLPHIVLEPVMPKLSTHRWFAGEGKQRSPEDGSVDLRKVEVDLWVRLATTRLKFKDLLDLEPGDVIILDRKQDEEVELYVGNQPKFKALPGRRGKRLAVRVTGLINNENGGDRR